MGSRKPTFSFAYNALTIEERIRDITERAAAERGMELVHVETARGAGRGQTVVRIFIDKPDGITHADCVEISHHVGTVLDVEDPLPDSYTLEVSSPGLERGLYRLADYERFTGEQARLKTDRAIGNQRNFRGRIIGVDGDDIIFDDRTSGEVRVPFDAIAKANIEIDTEAEFRFANRRSREGQSAGDGDDSAGNGI